MGILVERAVEMAVGMLGVLKAGGAYVRWTRLHPGERLALLLGDTGAGVLVTQNFSNRERLPERTLSCLLDADWPAISREDTRDFAEHGDARQPGLRDLHLRVQGCPKGRHRAPKCTNLVSWARSFYASRGTRRRPGGEFDLRLPVVRVFCTLCSGAGHPRPEHPGSPAIAGTGGSQPDRHRLHGHVRSLVRLDGIPASVRSW